MIKKILEQLAPQDFKAIMDAFDNLTPHYIRLDDDHFIGVHTDTIDNLEPEEEAGFFKYGRIKDAKNKEND